MSDPIVVVKAPNGGGKKKNRNRKGKKRPNGASPQVSQPNKIVIYDKYPRAIGNMSKRHPKSASGGGAPSQAVEKFFMNMCNPEHAFLAPRLVPTEAVPNFFKTTMTVPVAGAMAGALLIQPSMTFPVAYLALTEPGSEYTNTSREQMHHISNSYATKLIDIDVPLISATGTKTPSSMDNGLHYDEDQSTVKNGGRYYQGKVSGCNLVAHVTNRGSNQINVVTTISDVTNGVRTAPINSVLTVVNVGATVGVPFAATFSSGAGEQGVAIGLTFQNVGSTHTINVDVQLSGALTMDQNWQWQPLPFFSGGSDPATLLAFNEAEKFSVTGFSALLTNTSNSLNKGGSIRAVQLPGGTRHFLPGTPDEIFEYLGARQTIHQLDEPSLKHGAFWSYRPEKIQDFMFRKHPVPEDLFLYGDRELPYLAIAYKWPNQEQAPELSLTLRMNIEYLTVSVVAARFLSPADSSRLLELWLMLGNGINHVSHNPEHIQRVKDLVRGFYNRTLKNPEFRAAAVKAGRTLGQLALGASALL